MQLLLLDLGARVTYGVNCVSNGIWKDRVFKMTGVSLYNKELPTIEFKSERGGYINVPVNLVKPYLRPMSNMTDKEKEEIEDVTKGSYRVTQDGSIVSTEFRDAACFTSQWDAMTIIDWLNAHHFDYHGLITKNLAFEAPKGMYN